MLWRRSYDVPPPPMPEGDPRSSLTDPRYRDVPAEFIPATECLKDVVARVTPYFADVIVEDLRSEAVRGGAVIVVAHGNSLRALRMVLQNIPEDEIAELEIPTGIPYRVTLDDGLNILSAGYLVTRGRGGGGRSRRTPGRLVRGLRDHVHWCGFAPRARCR